MSGEELPGGGPQPKVFNGATLGTKGKYWKDVGMKDLHSAPLLVGDIHN